MKKIKWSSMLAYILALTFIWIPEPSLISQIFGTVSMAAFIIGNILGFDK